MLSVPSGDLATQREALSAVLGFDNEPALEELLSPEQQVEAMAVLSDLGVATSDAEVRVYRGAAIINAQGSIFGVRELLDGAYDPRQVGGLIEKGYRVSGSNPPVGTDWSDDIKLRAGYGVGGLFASLAEGAGQEWSNAQFGSLRADNLDMSFNNTGADSSDITFWIIPSALWSSGPCPNTGACVDAFPSGTRPGRNILFVDDRTAVKDTNGNFLTCAWSWELIYHTLLHEMGHAIGFTHPADKGSTRVPYTLSEVSNPGYGTVMRGAGGCVPTLFNLFSDDRETVTRVY